LCETLNRRGYPTTVTGLRLSVFIGNPRPGGEEPDAILEGTNVFINEHDL